MINEYEMKMEQKLLESTITTLTLRGRIQLQDLL